MRCFVQNENGQGMVEYGLIIALVVLVIIIGLTAFGNGTSALFSSANEKLFAQ